MFPEYNRRSGRLYSLNDHIVDCLLRSENATGATDGGVTDDERKTLPSETSREVLAKDSERDGRHAVQGIGQRDRLNAARRP